MKVKKSLILSSGGIDSTACLHFCKSEKITPVPFYINYGQRASANELKALKKICAHYKLKINIAKYSSNAAFGKGEIIGRNAFLLLSALMTFGKKYGIVTIGIHKGTFYPDCSKEFLTQMQAIYDTYTNGTVRILAPFIEWTKNDIWTYCIENKIPVHLSYSCEEGKKQPCGKCLSCNDLKNLYASKML